MHECSAAAARRLLIVLSARGQENGLWGFTSTSARNTPEWGSVLAPSAGVGPPFNPRRTLLAGTSQRNEPHCEGQADKIRTAATLSIRACRSAAQIYFNQQAFAAAEPLTIDL